MHHFVVVALSKELHLRDSPLRVLKVVLFDASDHLFKRVVHHSHDKVALILLERGQHDSNAFHVIVASRAYQEKNLSEQELFVLSPWNRQDVGNDGIEVVFDSAQGLFFVCGSQQLRVVRGCLGDALK